MLLTLWPNPMTKYSVQIVPWKNASEPTPYPHPFCYLHTWHATVTPRFTFIHFPVWLNLTRCSNLNMRYNSASWSVTLKKRGSRKSQTTVRSIDLIEESTTTVSKSIVKSIYMLQHCNVALVLISYTEVTNQHKETQRPQPPCHGAGSSTRW